MSGELAERPLGHDRHPWDFYVEDYWVTEVLCDMIDLEKDVQYLDPTCGLCHIPAVLQSFGLVAFGTDIERRIDSHLFLVEHNFIGDQRLLIESAPKLSIMFNPPFSNQNGKIVPGLAEMFVRRALAIATHKVAALLPVKWLGSRGRYRLFSELPPSIYIMSERPSMPPGHLLDELGPRCAYKRGKVDYMWAVWDKQAPRLPYAPTFWIPPRPRIEIIDDGKRFVGPLASRFQFDRIRKELRASARSGRMNNPTFKEEEQSCPK